MASSISLLLLWILALYLCFLQLKIASYCEDRNQKFYVRLLVIFYLVSLIWFYLNVDIRFPLDLIIIIGQLSFIVIFWSYNLINKHVLHRDMITCISSEEHKESKSKWFEFSRKFFHVFIFFGTLLFLFIYNSIMVDFIEIDPDFGAEVDHVLWESIPLLSDLNIDVVYDLDLTYPPPIEILMMIFFMIILPYVIVLEYFRTNPRLGIPMHKLFANTLRTHEVNNTADFYYFFFGLFIATFWLPIEFVFAIFALMTFGDSAASICGRRIKDSKRWVIKWEPKKCYQGSIAGTIVTFISTFLFIGWFLGLILASIFLLFDLFTPTTIKISDNILYPMACIVVLLLFVLIGFEPDALIGNYFRSVNQWYIERIPELIY